MATAEGPLPAQPAQHSKTHSPLKLNELLVENFNSWGNVQYNYPLRVSDNETRTSTSIAHRLIPDIPYHFDCKINDPLPDRVVGRDLVVDQETYKTTSGEYCVQPNPNKAMERADCAMNCRRVSYMTSVEKQLLGKHIRQPILISEMKDKYRGIPRPPQAPPDIQVNTPDSYIFNVVAAGRNDVPCIYDTSTGYRKQMDPYLTTYRNYHRPFTEDEHYGIAAKDHITMYTDNNTPKTKGFGPKFKELWMPLLSGPRRAVFDRIHVRKEFKEVAASHNLIPNIKGIFESEYNRKYKVPFSLTALASWSSNESFDLPNYPPSPYQTTVAPFMYCSDYCHVGQRTSPGIVINQNRPKMPPHRPCKESYIVSRDFTV